MGQILARSPDLAIGPTEGHRCRPAGRPEVRHTGGAGDLRRKQDEWLVAPSGPILFTVGHDSRIFGANFVAPAG